MSDRRLRAARVCLAAAFLFQSALAMAQTNERIYESLEFRVVTPGARAVSMGKTFVGIADDATAAASNPAGLSNLIDPEVSFEFTSSRMHHTRMSAVAPVQTLTFHGSAAFPSFASAVMPLPGFRKATIGAFYNSLQQYEETFEIPGPRTFPIRGRSVSEDGYFGNVDIEADAFGVSGAYILTPSISLGGSLTFQRLRIDGSSNSGSPARPRNGTNTHDDDNAFSGQLGVLIKPSNWLSIGAALNRGATFEITTVLHGVFAPENSPPLDPVPIEQIRTDRIKSPVQTIDYRIPDRVTAGTAIRPREWLTLLLDVGFVQYSQRVTDNFLFVDFLNQQQSAKFEIEDYYFDNEVEVHTGGEFRTIRRGLVLAFRGGFFTDPEHHMRFDFENSSGSDQAFGQSVRFNTLERGTTYGFTGGGGLVFMNTWQIDAAYSHTRDNRELVLSSVFRFPG